jgi:hypothetical protein
MKRVLIISPYFPPTNTADIQRIRMSLPYFKENGWEAEVVTVDECWSDLPKDDLLIETVPADIKTHKINAFSKKWTSKLGFGNIAFRSYFSYKKKVNKLLRTEKFDLIYFSTTQFPICILGAYWKKHFGVPYVIDMQDAWYSTYYDSKSKDQQPPKYKLSYGLHKYLEPIAMKQVGGLISVSENYITELKHRYPSIKNIPADTITFGSFAPDIAIASKNKDRFTNLLEPGFKNIVYIGRGGMDMHKAIIPVFTAFKSGLKQHPDSFNKLKFYFFGTSYAPKGETIPTILPLARQFGIKNYVIEITDRISYFHSLVTLQQADALFIPGSDDPNYTASKIYPYILANKPLLAVFNSNSSALDILSECGVKHSFSYDQTPEITSQILDFLEALATNTIAIPDYKSDCIAKYSAQNLTKKQCDLFNRVIATK